MLFIQSANFPLPAQPSQAMEHTEAAPADQTPANAPASAAPRGSRWFFPMFVGTLVVLAVGGGAGGWFLGSQYLWPQPTDVDKHTHEDDHAHKDHGHAEKHTHAETHGHAEKKHSDDHGHDKQEDHKDHAQDNPERAGLDAVEQMRRIDEYIGEGRYSAALEETQRVVAPNAPLPRPARYRAALCLEALDRPADAITHYRACATASAEPHLTAAAQLGLARASMRAGQSEEGQSLLCALLTQSADPLLNAYPYRVDAACLLALALADQVLARVPATAINSNALAGVISPWPVERYVAWSEAPIEQPRKLPAPQAKTPLTVTRKGKAPETYQVTAFVAKGEVPATLESLAKLADLTVQWTSDSHKNVVARHVTLACRDVPLADLIDWLTLPYGLGASIEASTIKIQSIRAMKPAPRRQFLATRAVRKLVSAQSALEKHPFAGDVYLALGNLELSLDHTTEAAVWYERLAREHPRSPALVAASYNLGLLRLSQGDTVAARAALYQTIDLAPESDMVGLSYWWLGRSHLDEKDLVNAERLLSRARQGGPKSPTALAAVLALSCRAMIEGEYRQGWELLRDHRDSLRQTPYATITTFLDAYARFRLAGDDAVKVRNTSVELVAILIAKSKPGQDDWLGPAYPYLQGQALRQLGMNQEMVSLYDRAAKSLHGGVLADEMNQQSAEVVFAAGKWDDARKRFDLMAKESPRLWGQSQLRLAELDLRENKAKECVARCRAMLAAKQEPAAILGIMGRAYAAMRDFSRAAKCFEGKVPDGE